MMIKSNVYKVYSRSFVMIVYSGTITKFNDDIDNGRIAWVLKDEFEKRGISGGTESEIRSWLNSLLHMKNVINYEGVDKDIHVAIEYQIPTTSKRVDFIITGLDEYNNKNVVIVELKQWERAESTNKEGLVSTYLGGANRLVTHPSYQAYSYAKTIENYNEYVQKNKIFLYPCGFLHNYRQEYMGELINEKYHDIIKIAPLFLQQDGKKLAAFIQKYISKADNGELLYEIDHGKIKPSKALQDSIVSMIRGKEEFLLIDEQKVAFSTIKNILEETVDKKDEKYTIIIEGGPGTGKSVIAINLLAHFKHLTTSYVTKNAAPRNVYFSLLRKGDFKLNYVNNLFKSSGSFINSNKNDYDLLIVDEAHRLNEKSGMFQNLGQNQIAEIINAAKVSVFFIDEDQIVTTKDFGSINEIKEQAKLHGSKVLSGQDLVLTSQFRCNGSDGYIAFLDHILGIRETANYDGFDLEYDIRIFDDPNEMRNELREKNAINNKARMIAGYAWNWVSKTDQSLFDIRLNHPSGFKAKWNFSNTTTWAIDSDSFEEVGCIHTAQGLEFDYVGVIIGDDMRYENGRVITDYTKRAKTDQSLKGIKTTKNYALADRIIRNTYKTLLSRAQKGCFIYCTDKKLSKYLKEKLKFRINLN